MKRLIVICFLLSFITACGTDSTYQAPDFPSPDYSDLTAPLSGIFVDSPVQGLTYETPSQSGQTDENGTFTYREGETITFSVGSVVLGSAIGHEILTPLDLFPMDSPHAATNVISYLLSLDSDYNGNNGTQIPSAANNVSGQTLNFNATTAFFQESTDVSAYFDEVPGATLNVTPEEANAHFDTSMSLLDTSVKTNQIVWGETGLPDLEYLLTTGGEDYVLVGKGGNGSIDKIVGVNATGETAAVIFDALGFPAAFYVNGDAIYYAYLSSTEADIVIVEADGTTQSFASVTLTPEFSAIIASLLEANNLTFHTPDIAYTAAPTVSTLAAGASYESQIQGVVKAVRSANALLSDVGTFASIHNAGTVGAKILTASDSLAKSEVIDGLNSGTHRLDKSTTKILSKMIEYSGCALGSVMGCVTMTIDTITNVAEALAIGLDILETYEEDQLAALRAEYCLRPDAVQELCVDLNRPPEVSIIEPTTTTFTAGDDITFVGTITDNEDLDLYPTLVWSNGDTILATGTDTLTLTNVQIGTYVISLTGTDTGGKSTTDSITIEITEDSPPTAIIHDFSYHNFLTGDSYLFSGEASDPEDVELSATSLQWYFDGTLSGSGHEILLSNLAEGPHTITLKATDSAGNIDEVTATFYVNISYIGTYTGQFTVSNTVEWPNAGQCSGRVNLIATVTMHVYDHEEVLVNFDNAFTDTSNGGIYWSNVLQTEVECTAGTWPRNTSFGVFAPLSTNLSIDTTIPSNDRAPDHTMTGTLMVENGVKKMKGTYTMNGGSGSDGSIWTSGTTSYTLTIINN